MRELPHPHPGGSSLPSPRFPVPALEGLGAPRRSLPDQDGCGSSRRRGRCRGIGPSAQPSRGSEPRPGPSGRSRALREVQTSNAALLPRPRLPPPPHQAASSADMGWGGGGAGGTQERRGVCPCFPRLRLIWERDARVCDQPSAQRRRPEFRAQRAHKSLEDHCLDPLPHRAATPPPGWDTPPSDCCRVSLRLRPWRCGRREGGRKERGQEAGRWGGAGDQVIRRIINLNGSLG